MKAVERYKMNVLIVCLSVCLAVMCFGISNAGALLIRDDPTGGECVSFGIWEEKTKTCTLTADLWNAIQIVSNGVTLNGNDYTIRGDPANMDPSGRNLGAAVTVYGLNGVTVTHVRVENFETGIYLGNVTNTAISHNVFYDTYSGIWLSSSSYNRLVANVSLEAGDGILLEYSTNNTIAANVDEASVHSGIKILFSDYNNIIGNTVNLCMSRGIRIAGSSHNTIAGNTVSMAGRSGIMLSGYSTDNYVINNNMIDNVLSIFNWSAGNTISGNYWSEYDSEEEGCLDADSDGFCDAPYEFEEPYVGDDMSPRVTSTVLAAIAEVTPNIIKTDRIKEKETALAVYIEVPGYAPADIVIESVRLLTDNGFLWANETPTLINDYDGNGIVDLMVKFNRWHVAEILNAGLNEVAVTGTLGENTFEAQVFLTLE